MLARCRGEWCREKEAALVQCKASSWACWETARICRVHHSRLCPRTGTGWPSDLSWAQWGLEVCHCGTSPGTDSARAGTSPKTLQPRMTMLQLGQPKTKSSRGKSERSRYQQTKADMTDRNHHAYNHKPPVPHRQSRDKVSTTCGENRGI